MARCFRAAKAPGPENRGQGFKINPQHLTSKSTCGHGAFIPSGAPACVPPGKVAADQVTRAPKK